MMDLFIASYYIQFTWNTYNRRNSIRNWQQNNRQQQHTQTKRMLTKTNFREKGLTVAKDKCCRKVIHRRENYLKIWEAMPKLFLYFFFGRKPNIMDNMITIMERYTNNLEELVDERTEELRREKAKTEQLLHRMLPPWVPGHSFDLRLDLRYFCYRIPDDAWL